MDQNAKYSLKRNWKKSVLGLHVPLKNSLDALCTGDWCLTFQVSNFLNFQDNTLMHEYKLFTQAQRMHA